MLENLCNLYINVKEITVFKRQNNVILSNLKQRQSLALMILGLH